MLNTTSKIQISLTHALFWFGNPNGLPPGLFHIVKDKIQNDHLSCRHLDAIVCHLCRPHKIEMLRYFYFVTKWYQTS